MANWIAPDWLTIDAKVIARLPTGHAAQCWARGVWGLIHLEHDDFNYAADAVVWC